MKKIYGVPINQPGRSWNSGCKQWHASLTWMTYKSHLYSVLSFMLSLKMSKRHFNSKKLVRWLHHYPSPDLLQHSIFHQLSWHENVNVVYNSHIKFYYRSNKGKCDSFLSFVDQLSIGKQEGLMMWQNSSWFVAEGNLSHLTG